MYKEDIFFFNLKIFCLTVPKTSEGVAFSLGKIMPSPGKWERNKNFTEEWIGSKSEILFTKKK